MDSQTIAKRIEKEVSSFDAIIWGALGQKSANPKRRTAMITAAFDNLRSFMAKTLAAAPAEKIIKPGGMATAGKGVSTMPVKEKIQSDIQRLHQRIAVLKSDPANAGFFVQSGGKLLDPVSVEALLGNPVVDDAQPEDLQAALAVLQENVASLLAEIEALSTSAPVTKTANENAAPFDGVFSRYGERQQLVAKLAVEKRKSFGQPVSWNGVWSGRA